MVGLLFKVCLNKNRSGCLILIYVEALTNAVNTSTNCIEDIDHTYFPTIKELVSSLRIGRLLKEGLCKKSMRETVDELAMKSSHFSNLDKSASGGNIDGSQGERTQFSSSQICSF